MTSACAAQTQMDHIIWAQNPHLFCQSCIVSPNQCSGRSASLHLFLNYHTLILGIFPFHNHHGASYCSSTSFTSRHHQSSQFFNSPLSLHNQTYQSISRHTRTPLPNPSLLSFVPKWISHDRCTSLCHVMRLPQRESAIYLVASVFICCLVTPTHPYHPSHNKPLHQQANITP